MAGGFVGGIAGIVKGGPPLIFGAAASVQWFTIASTFYGRLPSGNQLRIGMLTGLRFTHGVPTGAGRSRPYQANRARQVRRLRRRMCRTGGRSATYVFHFSYTQCPLSPCADDSLGGRGNILPGVIVFSILGGTGATIYNTFERALSTPTKSWLESRWSPLKPLTDGDYAKILEEKILGIEVDISLIDERISKLKEQSIDGDKRPPAKQGEERPST